MSASGSTDLFAAGRTAWELARLAFAGRGFFVPARTLQPGFVRVPYTFGESEDDRRRRLVAVGASIDEGKRQTTEDTEDTEAEEKGRVRTSIRRTPSPPAFVCSVSSVVNHPIVPTPVGEAQGLDTIQFFAACRIACPAAHIVADLELLGHKLGQLCLSFGADAILGSIVDQRELRLGPRAGSNELTRDEAAQLLRASGFEPCAGLPEGKARQP